MHLYWDLISGKFTSEMAINNNYYTKFAVSQVKKGDYWPMVESLQSREEFFSDPHSGPLSYVEGLSEFVSEVFIECEDHIKYCSE